MIISFKCPLHGIPIVGEWDGDGEVMFDLEDEERDREHWTEDQIAEAEGWCSQRRYRYFATEERANAFLTANGITERWQRWSI